MKSKTISLAEIVVSLLAVVSVVPIAKAQTTIDVEKITCEQFVTVDVAEPNQIGLWLSGYFHGKHGDKILRVQELRKNIAALKSACHLPQNIELPVIEVSEKLFPSR